MLNYSTIPVIVVICYLLITAIKTTKIDGKWYPIISCFFGIGSAVAMYCIVPDFLGASSITVAIVSGAISGLAATGSHQVFKQLLKAAENGEDLSKVKITHTDTDITEANIQVTNDKDAKLDKK